MLRLNKLVVAVAHKEFYGSSSEIVSCLSAAWKKTGEPGLRPDPTPLLQGRSNEWIDSQLSTHAKVYTLANQSPGEAGIRGLRFR